MGKMSGSLVTGPGPRLFLNVDVGVEPPLIDRSSEYITFISEIRAGAIYGEQG